MYAVYFLIIILTLLLLIVAFVLTFSVPIKEADFQPLLTDSGYIVINTETQKIELSQTADTAWLLSHKYGFIAGYTDTLGILCMSTEFGVSGRMCTTSDTERFYIQGSTIRSNGSCLVVNDGVVSLGSCNNALQLQN